MFETAELGRKVSKAEYNKVAPVLRTDLLEIQQKLREADVPVIIVFGGVDVAGKNETINLLNTWMDPRWIATCAYGPPSDEEGERPEFWRFWRDLPPKGLIGLYLSAWYSRPVLERVNRKIDDVEFDKKLDRIQTFEKELADDGALILKFWMHLGRDAQRKRFKALEKDSLTSWRVTKTDWENLRRYDDFITAAERAITRTSTGDAPWHVIEGYDFRYCGLTVAMVIRDALQKHLDKVAQHKRLTEQTDTRDPEFKPSKEPDECAEGRDRPNLRISTGITILSRLDMHQTLSKKEYQRELIKYQALIHRLHRQAIGERVSMIAVFEGWDAAGKGGAIRRVAAALDARDYRVIPFAAPTDEERRRHYLWRFWRQISRAGRVTFFDRSWYGRVLVERIEGFASEPEWQRAYAEINDFEQQLVGHGLILCKFWLHISPDEQLKRFKEREEIAYKKWKLTTEDWRNREKWDLYEEAVNDMVERTSTGYAPWTLVEGNDKRFARIKVLQTLCSAIREAFK
jgi:polyphosphate:AMP phosphotransferase